MIFSPEPVNFYVSDKPTVEFPNFWESPEKNKNLKLIKMARNENRAKRKCYTSFFAFHILDLKIVPKYAKLNSAPENQTHFSKKVGVVPRKTTKLEKVVQH